MKFYVIYRLTNAADIPQQRFEEYDTRAEADEMVADLRRSFADARWYLEVQIVEGRLLLPETGPPDETVPCLLCGGVGRMKKYLVTSPVREPQTAVEQVRRGACCDPPTVTREQVLELCDRVEELEADFKAKCEGK